MKHLTFALLLLPFLVLIIACQEDENANIQNPPVDKDTLTVKKVNIDGFIQKGPFINGTAVIISELDDSLVATGKNFNTQIADNKGSFEIRNIELTSDYVQLTANGFYFDEVKGEKSAAQLTLFALANILNASSINVNILSHLEKDRVHFLIRQGKSFAEAKKQSQQEILAIFGIVKEDMNNSELLDISQEGDDNAILLAISAILQGNNTVAELSELLANINTDIKEDGKLDSNSSREKLVNNAKALDLVAIRDHIEKRYDELGVTSTIPNFEKYIDSDGDGILNGDEDDTPDDFAFEPQVDVAINQSITSNEITINGIKEGGKANIYVTNGAFIINGKAVGDTVAQVVNGDKIQIKIISSNEYYTTVKAKIAIGSLVKFFEATTDNYTPDAFSFTSEIDVAVDSFIISETITLSGIPYPTPASISNGIIIKNGVELTTDTTSFKEGDKIAIKLLSSESFSTSTKAMLSVNGVEGSFEVTTDDYAPDDFTFSPKENVPIDTIVVSETITLSGIPFPTPASISNGVIIKNGIEISSDTTSFKSEDKVAVKLLSSESFSTKTVATLSINGLKRVFEVTTDDYVPNAFSFTPIENAKKDTVYISNAVVVSGLLYPTPVSITNGTLIINDIELEGNETSVVAGDKIAIKANSSSEFSEKTMAILQIGSKTKIFEIITQPNPWKEKAYYPGEIYAEQVGFVINDKIYIGTGVDDVWHEKHKEFYEYNIVTNKWSKIADFGGGERSRAVAFSLGGKGYVGLGNASSASKDFWEYDPTADTWTQIADFEGEPRDAAVCFTLNNKPYVGLGQSQGGVYNKDFWEYDPTSDTWTQIADFEGIGRKKAWSFVIDGKVFIGCGINGSEKLKDVWAYDQQSNIWSQKNNFVDYNETIAFSVNDQGYATTYWNVGYKLYKYNSTSDIWNLIDNDIPADRVNLGVSMQEKAYLFNFGQDLWEYTPPQP